MPVARFLVIVDLDGTLIDGDTLAPVARGAPRAYATVARVRLLPFVALFGDARGSRTS